MTENGCWNCHWENLHGELESCKSCYMFDKWEKDSEFKEDSDNRGMEETVND
ncbi:hypothetical protein KA005_76675 [bacterium]|nr:hypothetical protein [bacterium]